MNRDDVPLPPHGRPPMMESDRRCRVCDNTAAYATLSSYGGMCGHCYAEYCRRPMTMQPRSALANRTRAEIAAKGFKVPA